MTTQVKTIGIAAIAKQAKVDPKHARSRLRRATFKGRGALPKPVQRGRWVWKVSDAARIRNYISD